MSSIGMFISLGTLSFIFGSASFDELGKVALSDAMG
jgi:hypothetical protein